MIYVEGCANNKYPYAFCQDMPISNTEPNYFSSKQIRVRLFTTWDFETYVNIFIRFLPISSFRVFLDYKLRLLFHIDICHVGPMNRI